MNMGLILAIDVGTGSTKVAAYNIDGIQIAAANSGYATSSPAPGLMEQDAEDWWRATVEGCRELAESGVDMASVIGVGLSGQMQNCLVLGEDGRPLRPAILYSDIRGIEEAHSVASRIGAEAIRAFTANEFTLAATGAKLLWLKAHESEVYARTTTVVSGAKDYVAYGLTGAYATDPTNGATTGLMNVHTRDWEFPFIREIGLREEMLPPIMASAARVGCVARAAARATGLPEGCPVFCGAGNAGAASVGAGTVSPERAHCYLGTTGWVATIDTSVPKSPPEGLNVLCDPDPSHYILVAPLLNAGRAYEWAVATLARLEQKQAEEVGRSVYDIVESRIESVPPGSNGLIFLPYLAGERSPFTDPNARGVFFGLSEKTTPMDMVRSAMEGVSYAIRQSMTAVGCMNRVREVVLIGGGSKSDTWAHILADVCECAILVPEDGTSGPCLGAAVAAMVGMDILDGYSDVDLLLRISRRYECREANAAFYRPLFGIYESLYPAVKGSFQQLAAARGH